MTHDLVVVGTPFLDVTFEGLARVPRPGEELLARAVHVGPGGTGMQAIAAARLGLSTALAAPLGGPGGALLRASLATDGVAVVGDDGDDAAGAGVPVTALLSTPAGVAMASALGGGEPAARDVARAGAACVLASLGRLGLAPEGTRVYAVTGGLELPHVRDALARARGLRALVSNAAEAIALTGRRDAEEAAHALARAAATVVVTLGRDGALALEEGRVARAPAPHVETVDATGAGDLFAAAYVWADVRGAAVRDRLAWASLYAGLSVRAPTALAGALRLDELLRAGAERGLQPPPALRG
ncbi:MAG TPA: PfkB family carbohydrate kinase [Actinomycetota bacterium]|nr:PfkB family carbohydrate kinase [Actinomycetota bacterium]